MLVKAPPWLLTSTYGGIVLGWGYFVQGATDLVRQMFEVGKITLRRRIVDFII